MIENQPSRIIQTFWQTYLDSLPAQNAASCAQIPPAWGFCDGGELADQLGALVVAGTKTATCSLLWEYEVLGESVPQVGDLSIILDGKENPLCIIQTSEITLRPFNEVDAAFAYDEGEDDRTLESWRKAHWDYFGRTCKEIGKKLDETMPLVCERFRVIWRS
jgi:uncharacterized protein YhfF